jgi:hypothetical protein
LGTDDGTIWSEAFMLDITKAGEVAKVAKKLMNDKEHNSASLCIVTTNPHSGTPCVMLMSQYLGPAEKYIELTKNCADARMCGFAYEMVSGDLKKILPNSAWAHRDVETWM